MSTKLVAWATTAISMPGADPGLLVQEVEMDDHQEVGYTDLRSTVEPSGWGETEDGGWDTDALDTALEALGYTRTGSWSDSGGQMAAEAERT